MVTKAQRRQRILELIRDSPIRSQQMLQDRLALEGITVTQATLSRDLADMKVLKSADGYLPPQEPGNPSAGARVVEQSLERMLLSISTATAMVVLRTPPGHANALAVELDRMRTEGIVGTLAGDDTIFIAVESEAVASELSSQLRRMASGAEAGV